MAFSSKLVTRDWVLVAAAGSFLVAQNKTSYPVEVLMNGGVPSPNDEGIRLGHYEGISSAQGSGNLYARAVGSVQDKPVIVVMY